jgi:hypothetical protein
VSASRINYFDWMRGTAVLSIVAYHALLPFTGDWLVNDAEMSEVLGAALLLFETFGLGLLFVLGVLLFSPIIWYIAAIHGGSTSVSYPEYLATWPREIVAWALGVGFSPKLFQAGVHLWFLAWLFSSEQLPRPDGRSTDPL